jgi:catechol 2,3-dioxygenase-like lactoylglutathione lyase family enzyme
MPITRVRRVTVAVSDQDAAIAWYTGTLGFGLLADVPFGDGQRWVEVAPPDGEASLALVSPSSTFAVGRVTGVILESTDPAADRDALAAAGVDVDATLMGGDGEVPRLFTFRDPDGNSLMAVEAWGDLAYRTA